MDNKRMGFGALKNSSKSSPYFDFSDQTRTPEEEMSNRNYYAWLIVLLAFILIGGIVASYMVWIARD